MENSSLTSQETKLYDRQLRLWGVQAQQRLRQAKILLFGLTAVQSEICKNLVLAGIHSVTVGDVQTCTVRDLSSHLFLDHNSIGKNRAEASVEKIRELNPHVSVSSTTQPVDSIDLSQFDVCVLSGASLGTVVEVNKRARDSKTLFFSVETFGLMGYMFEDLLDLFSYEKKVEGETKTQCTTSVPFQRALESTLQHHSNPIYIALRIFLLFESRHKRYPTSEDTKELLVLREELLSPLIPKANKRSVVFKVDLNFIETLARGIGTEISPIPAILGGVVGLEIVKVICRNDEPYSNFFFLNGVDDDGIGCVQQVFPSL